MPGNEKYVLIVEDEAPLREATAQRLRDQGFAVVQAGTGEQALERLAEFAFDVVVTDLRLPGVDGTQVLQAAVERYPEIIGIVVTGFGTVKGAVEAIKVGAADFITKPFQFDELLHVLSSALEQRRLKSENAYLRSQLQERYRFEGLVGPKPRDARTLPAARDGRADQQHDFDHGGNRDWQGARRPRHSPQQPAPRPPAQRPELRGHSGDALGNGAVRARAGCVHRRRRIAARPPGEGAQGHIVPG